MSQAGAVGAKLTRLAEHAKGRAPGVAVVAVLALFGACARPSIPPKSVEGVASMLGAAIGGSVRADDFVWEPRRGFLLDAFLGRRVLFLGSKGGGPRDLYRALVRVTRSGQPILVRDVANLTDTPDGDEHDLIAAGSRVAFVATAGGLVSGVTLLDRSGPAREARTLRERARTAIGAWADTGSIDGLGRVDITFSRLLPTARIELNGDLLVLSLGDPAEAAALHLDDLKLDTGASDTFGARASVARASTPSWSAAVGGAARIAFGDAARDAVRRELAVFDHAVVARSDGPRRGAEAASTGGFPPARFASPSPSPLGGEGAWMDTTPTAHGSIATTFVRPDPKRPEIMVELAALDLRRLELGFGAGFASPRSTTGPRASGHLVDVPSERVVAVARAGPAERELDQARDLGVVAEGRALVAPRRGFATIAVEQSGFARFGRFVADEPTRFSSLLQTPDPLISKGIQAVVARPSRGAALVTARTALGFLADGNAILAWSSAADLAAMTRALELAGASYAVPLAAGASDDALFEPHAADGELSPRESAFVFLATRPPAATVSGGLTWSPDAGKQPPPEFLPALFEATTKALGADVVVHRFAPGRFEHRLVSGAHEPFTKLAQGLSTTLAEPARALVALGVGTAKRRNARGLRIGGVTPYRFHDGAGAIALVDGGARVVTTAELAAREGVDATELPLLADEGAMRPEARDVGAMRARAAACSLEDGSFLVANAVFDSDEVTTKVLLDAGCARVVALDRGAHEASFFIRRPEQGFEPKADTTILYALEKPMLGRSRPFEP